MSTYRQQNKNGGSKSGGADDHQSKPNTTTQQTTATSSSYQPTKKHNIPILRYDSKAYSNFAKFEKDLEEHVGYEFGDLFAFSKTGTYLYQPVPVPRTVQTLIEEEKDAVPSTLSVAERARALRTIDQRWDAMSQEQKDIMAEGLKEEFKAKLRAHSSDQVKRRQDKIKRFWLIKSLLSKESLDVVKQHLLEKWTTVETEQDPLQLWMAVKQTHTTYSSGLKEVDESKARTAYSMLKQHKMETITAFKDRMEVYVRSMESLGMSVPSEGQLAADFISRLNDTYDSKRNILFNNAKLGGSYPKTLFEAYKIMTELCNESHSIKVASSSVFNVNKQNQHQNHHQNQNNKRESEAQTQGNNKSNKCFNCGGKGHIARVCPSASRRTTNASPTTTPAPNGNISTPAPAPANVPTAAPNSNQNPPGRVHFTQAEVMEFFGFTTICMKVDNGEDMLDTVLLDNQAQESIFCNEHLLTALVDNAVPHRYNGMGGGSVVATQSGSFHGIPGIDYSPQGNVNILSWSQMVQLGARVAYDGESDTFKLTISNETLIFKNCNGLYVLKFNNLVHLTTSEQQQAKMAVELQRRLAYPARSGMDHFLKSSAMSDVPIGSKAIQLIDEAIPYIHGKATRQAINYGQEIAGRVPLEKKTGVHADLMFLKPLKDKNGSKEPEKLNFIISVSDFGSSSCEIKLSRAC